MVWRRDKPLWHKLGKKPGCLLIHRRSSGSSPSPPLHCSSSTGGQAEPVVHRQLQSHTLRSMEKVYRSQVLCTSAAAQLGLPPQERSQLLTRPGRTFNVVRSESTDLGEGRQRSGPSQGPPTSCIFPVYACENGVFWSTKSSLWTCFKVRMCKRPGRGAWKSWLHSVWTQR